MKVTLRVAIYSFLFLGTSVIDSWLKQNYPESLQLWNALCFGVIMAWLMQLFEE